MNYAITDTKNVISKLNNYYNFKRTFLIDNHPPITDILNAVKHDVTWYPNEKHDMKMREIKKNKTRFYHWFDQNGLWKIFTLARVATTFSCNLVSDFPYRTIWTFQISFTIFSFDCRTTAALLGEVVWFQRVNRLAHTRSFTCINSNHFLACTAINGK